MTETPTPPAAIGYLRCSTKEQVESIPLQHGLIAEAAGKFEFALAPYEASFVTDDPDIAPFAIPGCFHDYGVAASKVRFLDRPSVAAMLNYMADHGIQTIVCAKMTRAFRNVQDCLDTVEKLGKSGVRMIILDVLRGQALDTTDAQSKFMLTIIAAAAELETALLSERITESNAHLQKQGFKIGELGYGWRLPDDAPPPGYPGRKRMKPVPHPEEQRILFRLLKGDLSTLSEREAARALKAEGIPTKKGGKWHASTVASIRKTGRIFEPTTV